MKILRKTNPDTSLSLLPWYVPFDQTKEQIGLELNDKMIHHPDDTLVLVVMDDAEKHILGFSIAYARYDDVFIWQARNINLSRPEVDLVLEQIYAWARQKGFSRIAAIPNRNPKIWKRRWGFIKSINNEVIKEI